MRRSWIAARLIHLAVLVAFCFGMLVGGLRRALCPCRWK